MLQDLIRSATQAPPFDAAAVPERVVVASAGAVLRLIWRDEVADIPAARLRAACRCAWCTRARIDGTMPESFAAVAIERVVPMGGYALNIGFDDDHARGIFPWVFLRKLTQEQDGQSK